MTEATQITLYIVMIGNYKMHSRQSIGAVYDTKQEAEDECRRIEKANTWAYALVVERQLEATLCTRRAGKTRGNMRAMLMQHTSWSYEMINSVIAETFDD